MGRSCLEVHFEAFYLVALSRLFTAAFSASPGRASLNSCPGPAVSVKSRRLLSVSALLGGGSRPHGHGVTFQTSASWLLVTRNMFFRARLSRFLVVWCLVQSPAPLSQVWGAQIPSSGHKNPGRQISRSLGRGFDFWGSGLFSQIQLSRPRGGTFRLWPLRTSRREVGAHFREACRPAVWPGPLGECGGQGWSPSGSLSEGMQAAEEGPCPQWL